MHRPTWILGVRGAVALAIGLLILLRPLESTAALALVLALWALIAGIATVAHAILPAGVHGRRWGLVIVGILAAMLGLAALYRYPVLTLGLLVAWTALWFLTTGVIDLCLARVHHRLGLPWGWTFAIGVLSCVLGVLTLWFPAVSLATIMGVIAAFALVSGSTLIYLAFVLARTRYALRTP